MDISANLKHIPLYVLSIILPTGVIHAQEINTTARDSVKLRQQLTDANVLYEEVANGYTVHTRKDISGSVSFVGTSGLTAVPAGNVSNLLQGRASGVIVIGSGQPGETSRVRIRGFSSLLNNDPLYIVDGVPTQDISSINPYDVASVSVLKDAGTASIYGSRASNGVIVLTNNENN